MSTQTLLEWTPDLELPGHSRTQEFISQQGDLFLRVRMAGDTHAEIEVNDHRIAEAGGFAAATALAEIYTRDRDLLLAARSAADEVSEPYYHLTPGDGDYRIYRCDEPDAAPDSSPRYHLLASAASIGAALTKAVAQAQARLLPVFADQREIYQGLAQDGVDGLVVAAWVARRRVPLVRLLDEDEYTPLYLAYGKGVDGLCFSIYRLVSREYLAEIRSHHGAEEIGKFPTLGEARAYCQLFHAAQHSADRVRFPKTPGDAKTSNDGQYTLVGGGEGYRLSTCGAVEVALGRFATIRQAEAYATVRRAAQADFAR